MAKAQPLLEIKDLKIEFETDERTVKAVNGVNLKVMRGQSVGIVGESGCGKTVTSYSTLGILPRNAKIRSGEILFYKQNGEVVDIAALDRSSREMQAIRGSEIAMIFQEPMTTFSPVHTIGNQMIEAIRLHQDVSKEEARARAIELLREVGINNPEQRIDEYSFQFSGGMRQRAMIALALACNPSLVLADEPTSALDVTIQAQVLQLLKRMQKEKGLAMIMITHDLGVVAHTVEYIYVMYLGRVIEEGSVVDIFDNPKHPYTQGLLKSIPRLSGTKGRLTSIEGTVPDYLPVGCPFQTRCDQVVGDICMQKMPEPLQVGPNQIVSCHRYTERSHSDDIA